MHYYGYIQAQDDFIVLYGLIQPNHSTLLMTDIFALLLRFGKKRSHYTIEPTCSGTYFLL